MGITQNPSDAEEKKELPKITRTETDFNRYRPNWTELDADLFGGKVFEASDEAGDSGGIKECEWVCE